MHHSAANSLKTTFMHFPQFTLNTTSMIQETINSRTYFFTVSHITRETDNRLIYGLRINNVSYFISKTLGKTDGEQLDTNPPLGKNVLKELNTVITQVELKHKKRQSLERINHEIFRILIRLRNFGSPTFKPSIG
jgi:hypothetical protein